MQNIGRQRFFFITTLLVTSLFLFCKGKISVDSVKKDSQLLANSKPIIECRSDFECMAISLLPNNLKQISDTSVLIIFDDSTQVVYGDTYRIFAAYPKIHSILIGQISGKYALINLSSKKVDLLDLMPVWNDSTQYFATKSFDGIIKVFKYSNSCIHEIYKLNTDKYSWVAGELSWKDNLTIAFDRIKLLDGDYEIQGLNFIKVINDKCTFIKSDKLI